MISDQNKERFKKHMEVFPDLNWDKYLEAIDKDSSVYMQEIMEKYLKEKYEFRLQEIKELINEQLNFISYKQKFIKASNYVFDELQKDVSDETRKALIKIDKILNPQKHIYEDKKMKKLTSNYFVTNSHPDVVKMSQVINCFDNVFDQDIDKPIDSDIVTHKRLCNGLHTTFCTKNSDYGNSFSKSVQKYGLTAALTRISDKFNRAEHLMLTHDRQVRDESLQDTLLDLANYCIMTVIELNKK